MNLKSILTTIFIKPLYLFFESIYSIVSGYTGSSKATLLVVGFFVALMLIPAYKMYNCALKENSDKTSAFNAKTLSKFILKPVLFVGFNIVVVVLFNSFFESCNILSGTATEIIPNLAKPDYQFMLFGKYYNILPVFLTLLNFAVCGIIVKKNGILSAIPMTVVAVFDFVYLYKAQSGVVISLLCSAVVICIVVFLDNLKNSEKIIPIGCSVLGVLFGLYFIFFYGDASYKMTVFYLAIALLMQLPLLYGKVIVKFIKEEAKPNKAVFFAGAGFLSVFIGVWIPSTVINASPQEFVDIYYYHNPLWYILSSFCFALGAFLVWLTPLYLFSGTKARALYDKIIWLACGTVAVNYFFFGHDFGIMTSALKFENGFDVKLNEQLINMAVILVLAALLIFVAIKFGDIMSTVLVLALAGIVTMSVVNVININSSLAPIKEQVEEIQADEPHFTLSKDGKNVVVLMIDRAIGLYTPYLFNEKPELTEQFSGFTYYENTLSFGKYTPLASASVYGGYEYTPAEMNARTDMLLSEKQDEALKVMPVLFDSNDYEVTVCDPSFAGYRQVPDLSIYDDYPEINTYITHGNYTDTSSKQTLIEKNYRNFFCYSLMKSSPMMFQETLYNGAVYNDLDVLSAGNDDSGEVEYTNQVTHTSQTATGIENYFMDAYNVLTNMNYITKISGDDSNNFAMMTNYTAHNAILLQKPDYAPAVDVDNTAYDAENSDAYTLNGKTLKMDTVWQNAFYQCNMAAMVQIGNWLDYLRENGVYDNTRIIIAADHGSDFLSHLDELILDDGTDIACYYPLLMVKDFDSTDEFKMSSEFMTSADVPTLATSGIIENPTNPFTNKPINSDEKTAHDQYVIASNVWDITQYVGRSTFLPSTWYSVSNNDMLNKYNWTKIADAVLTYDD